MKRGCYFNKMMRLLNEMERIRANIGESNIGKCNLPVRRVYRIRPLVFSGIYGRMQFAGFLGECNSWFFWANAIRWFFWANAIRRFFGRMQFARTI